MEDQHAIGKYLREQAGKPGDLVACDKRIAELEGYLERIGSGSPPKGEMPSLEQTPEEFRHQMWSWSQKHAREGLGAVALKRREEPNS